MDKEESPLQSSSITTLIPFFKERLSFIKENKIPTYLTGDPQSRFVMHFIPDKFSEIFLNIKNLERSDNHLVPIGEDPERILFDYNFDGILFLSSVHEKQAYTQVFRDGRIENVAAFAKNDISSGKKNFPILKFQKNIIACLTNHLSVLQRFSLPGPYYLFFRFLTVEGLRIDPTDLSQCGLEAKGRNKPLVLNELTLPRYRLEHDQINVKESLLPFFDIIWNTFGFKETPEIQP